MLQWAAPYVALAFSPPHQGAILPMFVCCANLELFSQAVVPQFAVCAKLERFPLALGIPISL
jgi:hypothetical protein